MPAEKLGMTAEKLDLVESNAPAALMNALMNGMAFRSWHYVTGLFSFSRDAPPESGCLDSGCLMSMDDRVFLKRRHPSL